MRVFNAKNVVSCWLMVLFLSYFCSETFAINTKNITGSNRSIPEFSHLRESSTAFSPLLQRQKRWLVYELGTAVTMTANCAKSILQNIPRALYWLAEATLIYSLPAGVEDWLPRRKPKTTKPPLPPPPPPPPPQPPVVLSTQPIIVPLSPSDPVQPFYFDFPQGVPFGRRSYVNHVQRGCPASNLVKDEYGTYFCRPWPSQITQSRRLRRELESKGTKLLNDVDQNTHKMLFDLLSLLSAVHNYKPRYCIMRTLCESRHLLAPPGKSLFHDMIRILLRHVHPEIAHKVAYREAFTSAHTLGECASLYGVQCPHSFLLEFSKMFHRKSSGRIK